jgi:3-phosphoshikimate 1-carboxyvinyltransferase
MIDEIPILSVAASFANGVTRIYGVKELKVKETDRLASLVHNLKEGGVKVKTFTFLKKGSSDWGIEIEGGRNKRTAHFKSFSDHRTAMSAIILGKAMERESSIDNTQCIDKSFPQFIPLLESF